MSHVKDVRVVPEQLRLAATKKVIDACIEYNYQIPTGYRLAVTMQLWPYSGKAPPDAMMINRNPDIIDRLVAVGIHGDQQLATHTMLEARNEILRLRQRLEVAESISIRAVSEQ